MILWPAEPGLKISEPGSGTSVALAVRASRRCVGPRRNRAQVQRRTFTPPTQTQRQTATGLRTTTAPRGPAQPARTTPLAQTAALAAVVSNVMVEPTAKRAEAMISKERMLFSRTFLVDVQVSTFRSWNVLRMDLGRSNA